MRACLAEGEAAWLGVLPPLVGRIAMAGFSCHDLAECTMTLRYLPSRCRWGMFTQEELQQHYTVGMQAVLLGGGCLPLPCRQFAAQARLFCRCCRRCHTCAHAWKAPPQQSSPFSCPAGAPRTVHIQAQATARAAQAGLLPPAAGRPEQHPHRASSRHAGGAPPPGGACWAMQQGRREAAVLHAVAVPASLPASAQAPPATGQPAPAG